MKGDLVLRYNSKLYKTFWKKFQVRWEGPFRVVDCFANGTYQLADLDGTLHASRVNAWRLIIYNARLMMVIKDGKAKEETTDLMSAAIVDGNDFRLLFAAADHE